MHLFPAIDLRGGEVVRLAQGDYDRQTTYSHDPLQTAQRFEQAGATWLHMVDLDGARSGNLTHLNVIQQVCDQTNLNVEVGGGVRTQAVIDSLLQAGVQRVVLGTAALYNWDWFASLMDQPTYHGRLVLGLDARDGDLAVSGWEQATNLKAAEVAARVSDWPLAAIVYTDIAVDGMLTGPNIQATRQMTQATRTPIVASGGVGTLDHLKALRKLPIQGAIVGKALYENAFTIEQAVATFERGE